MILRVYKIPQDWNPLDGTSNGHGQAVVPSEAVTRFLSTLGPMGNSNEGIYTKVISQTILIEAVSLSFVPELIGRIFFLI